MSVAQPITATREHAIHMAVTYTDKTTNQLVEKTVRIPRQMTRKADIAFLDKLAGETIERVLNGAAESSDAVITIALLKQEAPLAEPVTTRTFCGKCGHRLRLVDGEPGCVNAGCSNYIEAR